MAVEYAVEDDELVAAIDGEARYRGQPDGHKIDAATGEITSAEFTK